MRSLSALANLAADTIFMDWVIFWMFLTDFSLMAISFKLGILAVYFRICNESKMVKIKERMVTVTIAEIFEAASSQEF